MENEKPKRNWMEFGVTPPAAKSTAYVTINSEGRIAINREAWALLAETRNVSLLYDPVSRTIGIRPASPFMPNAFPITINKDGRRYIRGKQFIQAARIDISYSIRFLDPHLEDNTLILDLNHTTRVR